MIISRKSARTELEIALCSIACIIHTREFSRLVWNEGSVPVELVVENQDRTTCPSATYNGSNQNLSRLVVMCARLSQMNKVRIPRATDLQGTGYLVTWTFAGNVDHGVFRANGRWELDKNIVKHR